MRPVTGSWNSWLATFEPGERRYIETSLDDYKSDMRVINTPVSRRPEILLDRRFTVSLFTAVSTSRAGDVRYLLAVERVR
jgi:hypothetical protein